METKLATAARHLAKNDSRLSVVIKQAGACTIRPHNNYYQELVSSIISQQLSIKAAATIEKRFRILFNGKNPTPQQILETPHEKLRTVGLSNAKANYIRDLAQQIADEKLDLNVLNQLSNKKIIKELTNVKGIGEWTAHMFLMFAMGRLDVLAVGDLGIKNGIQKLYNLDHLPDATEIQTIARENSWTPYETVACWYIWKVTDQL